LRYRHGNFVQKATTTAKLVVELRHAINSAIRIRKSEELYVRREILCRWWIARWRALYLFHCRERTLSTSTPAEINLPLSGM
jgi:hypothetical protein